MNKADFEEIQRANRELLERELGPALRALAGEALDLDVAPGDVVLLLRDTWARLAGEREEDRIRGAFNRVIAR